MYSSQSEISIIDNTQHSLLLFHYGFIYIIVGSILCGIGYTCYTKINQLLKDLNEKYDVQLKNNVNDFNIKMDTMEIKYQTYIQKLETQIIKLEGKVNENNNYITDCNIKIDTMETKTETIVNDFNIKIEKLDFKVEHFKNIGKEATAVLSISTNKNIEIINNAQKEIDIIKTQIVDMKDTLVSQDQIQRLETQTHRNTNDAQNYIKLISNYVTKSKLQDLLVGYASQQELDEVAFECGKFEGNGESNRHSFGQHELKRAFTKCLNAGCIEDSNKHGHTCQGHRNGYYPDGCYARVIRINKKFYLYSTNKCVEHLGKLLSGPDRDATIFNQNPIYNTSTGYSEYYSCGRMNVTTKEISWH